MTTLTITATLDQWRTVANACISSAQTEAGLSQAPDLVSAEDTEEYQLGLFINEQCDKLESESNPNHDQS